MFFHLTELEHHPIQFDVTFAPQEIDFGGELHQAGDLVVTGKTELLKNTLGEIRVRGLLTATISAPCDRCLEEAPLAIDAPFDLFYRPVPKSGTPHAEVRIEEGEEELAFYRGDGLELKEIVREFVLLQVPMQHFCRPDCQGLCPVCGVNLNEKTCNCDRRPPDDRWSALRELR